jgi:hypothetical protein
MTRDISEVGSALRDESSADDPRYHVVNRTTLTDSQKSLDGLAATPDDSACRPRPHPCSSSSSNAGSRAPTWRASTSCRSRRPCSATPRSCANGAASDRRAGAVSTFRGARSGQRGPGDVAQPQAAPRLRAAATVLLTSCSSCAFRSPAAHRGERSPLQLGRPSIQIGGAVGAEQGERSGIEFCIRRERPNQRLWAACLPIVQAEPEHDRVIDVLLARDPVSRRYRSRSAAGCPSRR